MSKKELTMCTIVCDICKKHYEDEHSGFGAWNDYSDVMESAEASGWIENWAPSKNTEHYCPDCHAVNDEDEVINKKTGKVLFKN